MTCWEKYIADKTWVSKCIMNGERIPPDCPSHHGYLDDPTWCDEDGAACRMCWEREIPETENKEKENEKMSDDLIEKAYDEKYGSTSASAHMESAPLAGFKAEYERLKAENKSLKELISQKDIALLASMNQHAEDEERIKNLLHERNMYRYGLHVVEAFLGRDILEED